MISISPGTQEEIERDIIRILRKTAEPYEKKLRRITHRRGLYVGLDARWDATTTSLRYVVGDLGDKEEFKKFMAPLIPLYPRIIKNTGDQFLEELFHRLDEYRHSDKFKKLFAEDALRKSIKQV